MHATRKNSDQDRLNFEQYFHAEHLLCGSFSPRAFLPMVVQKPEPRFSPGTELAAAIEIFLVKIDDEIVQPLIEAESAERLESQLERLFPKFVELFRTLNHLLTFETSADKLLEMAHEQVERIHAQLVEGVCRLTSPEAAEEMRFALETYASAIDASRRVFELSQTAPPESAKQTWPLADRFRVGVTIHELGLLMIAALVGGRSGAERSIYFALDMLRGGALHAYSSVRQAEEQLSDEEEIGTPLPFDDDDFALTDAD